MSRCMACSMEGCGRLSPKCTCWCHGDTPPPKRKAVKIEPIPPPPPKPPAYPQSAVEVLDFVRDADSWGWRITALVRAVIGHKNGVDVYRWGVLTAVCGTDVGLRHNEDGSEMSDLGVIHAGLWHLIDWYDGEDSEAKAHKELEEARSRVW